MYEKKFKKAFELPKTLRFPYFDYYNLRKQKILKKETFKKKSFSITSYELESKEGVKFIQKYYKNIKLNRFTEITGEIKHRKKSYLNNMIPENIDMSYKPLGSKIIDF